MTRVLLVVTGDVEEVALGYSLSRIFPTADFHTVKKHAFTTAALRPVDTTLTGSRVSPFVEEMLAAGDVSRVPGGLPFDYVVAIEDVELANRPRPTLPIAADPQLTVISDHVARAVDLVLAAAVAAGGSEPRVVAKGKGRRFQRLETDVERRAFLAERCSFHLLCPMVEALFYAEDEALVRAGATRPSAFDAAARDLECFEVADAAFAAAPEGSASWARSARSAHPKHYLSFLCDSTGESARPYKEKVGGRRALESLDWAKVVAHSPYASLARALLADLADMLGVPLPGWAAGHCHGTTCHGKRGRLRNIA